MHGWMEWLFKAWRAFAWLCAVLLPGGVLLVPFLLVGSERNPGGYPKLLAPVVAACRRLKLAPRG